MSSNEEKIREKYAKNPMGEETRYRKSRTGSLEFLMTQRLLEPYITPESDVVEFGCATGYYAGLWHSKCRSYQGVDLVQEHVDFFNAKGLANAMAQQGDATNFPELANGSFDLVLCLGPMYHLPPEERALAMREMARICKPGGALAFAYINIIGVYFSAVDNGWGAKLLPWHKRWRQHYYPNPLAHTTLQTHTDDLRPGTFFFTMPEEMAALAEDCGLRVLRQAALDVQFNNKNAERMGEEQWALYQELCAAALEYPSCAGMSNHALLICRKEHVT
jgi:SAM-dependent methyltransferase